MTLFHTFRLLRFHGIEVVPSGDAFSLRGSLAGRDAVREAVHEHKAVIRALIRAGTLHCPSCRRILDPDGRCWHCPRCSKCGRKTDTPLRSLCDPCGIQEDTSDATP